MLVCEPEPKVYHDRDECNKVKFYFIFFKETNGVNKVRRRGRLLTKSLPDVSEAAVPSSVAWTRNAIVRKTRPTIGFCFLQQQTAYYISIAYDDHDRHVVNKLVNHCYSTAVNNL